MPLQPIPIVDQPEDYLELAGERYDEQAVRAIPAPEMDYLVGVDPPVIPDPVAQPQVIIELQGQVPPPVNRPEPAQPLVRPEVMIPAPQPDAELVNQQDESPMRARPVGQNPNAGLGNAPGPYAHIPIERFVHPTVQLERVEVPINEQQRPHLVNQRDALPFQGQQQLQRNDRLLPIPPVVVTRSGREVNLPNRFR